MAKSEHTPGPWLLSDDPDSTSRHVCQDNEARSLIAKVSKWEGSANYTAAGTANASLISAAPDLLDALSEILTYRGGADNALEDSYVMERAHAALAKATDAAVENKHPADID